MNFFKNRTNVTAAVIIIIVLALGYYLSNNKTSTKSSEKSNKTETSDNNKSATKSATSENTTMTTNNITSMTPAKDANLSAAPASVSMKFSKKIAGGSEIKVTDAKGVDVVPAANTISTDFMTLSVPVSISAKGTYTVKYSVVYQDRTSATGSYGFTYK